ncbi:hypothetical protein IGI04_002083, partial [Brassica rapa subsp. trilocularis]
HNGVVVAPPLKFFFGAIWEVRNMMRGGELMALDKSTPMQRPLEQLETPFEGRFRVRHERIRSDTE